MGSAPSLILEVDINTRVGQENGDKAIVATSTGVVKSGRPFLFFLPVNLERRMVVLEDPPGLFHFPIFRQEKQ